MTKVIKKSTEAVLLPTEQDTIYKLKIDRESQKFYIDDENIEYGEFDELTFRVLDTYTKLKVYNSDHSKTEMESTLFKFTGDARDSRGSHKQEEDAKTGELKTYSVCGRIMSTERTKAMTEGQKAVNKNAAKWYSYIFGIVSVPGQSPLLCDFQLSGNNIKVVGDILKKVKDEKRDYHRAELKFKAFKNEEFDWPEIEVTGDFSIDLPVTGMEPYFDTIKEVQEVRWQALRA